LYSKQNGVLERASIIQQPIAHPITPQPPQPTVPVAPTQQPKVVSPPANQIQSPDHMTFPRASPAMRTIQTPRAPSGKSSPLAPPKLRLLTSGKKLSLAIY